MAWSSSWKVSVTAVVVLLSRYSFSESRCDKSTLTIAFPDDERLPVKCATIVDGVNTLQHSLHVVNEGEGIYGVSFGDVQVIIGDLSVSTSASSWPNTTLAGDKLEHITGGIKIVGDLGSPTWNPNVRHDFFFNLTALRSFPSFEVDSLGDETTIYIQLGSLITSSVRITDTQVFRMDLLLDQIIQPSDFYFLRNSLRSGQDALKKKRGERRGIILPLHQVSGHLEFSGNPDLAILSTPGLESAGAIVLSNNTALDVFDSTIIRLGSISVNANPFVRLRLPDLQTLGGASTFSDLASLDLASLHNTTEPGTDFFFSENTFTSLDLPALETLATGLSIRENPFLNHTNLTNLRRVEGSLTIKGNPRLLTFSANRLVVVKGSVKLAGSFTNIEMYRLKEVAGDFEVGGDESMDCSWFDEQLRGKVLVVRGRYSCIRGYLASAGTGRPTEDEEQDGLLSTGAKVGIGVGGAVGGILVIGFSVWAFLAWKRNRATAGLSTGAEVGKPEMDGAGRADPPGHELGATGVSEPRAHQLDISPRPRTPELSDTCLMAELA